jgi:ATP-dependent RNA helicase RhlE
MKFEDYPIRTEIKRSLAELGFKKPTDIQFKAIKNIMQGEDVLAIAQTGTGKTAAFAIPVIHSLIESKAKKRIPCSVKALVMVPTHELAQQIVDVFRAIGKYANLNILGIFGSTDQAPQIAALEKGVDILVATPGRMFDLRSQGFIDFSNTEYLILDEADRMLALGFYDDIKDILRYIPARRQTLFFSATINVEIKKLAYTIVKNAIRIQISPDDPISKNITHAVIHVKIDDKRFFLERMIKENPEQKILVFVRTKVRAERVMAAMSRVEIASESMHSGKTHEERKSAMNNFKTGKTKILIATDVSARGVDIPNVDQVINYDLPDVAENYVHRIGRTGRGTAKGKAISFCDESENEYLAAIEEYVGKALPVQQVSGVAYEETIIFSDSEQRTFKDVMKEIAEYEAGKAKVKHKPKFVKKKKK